MAKTLEAFTVPLVAASIALRSAAFTGTVVSVNATPTAVLCVIEVSVTKACLTSATDPVTVVAVDAFTEPLVAAEIVFKSEARAEVSLIVIATPVFFTIELVARVVLISAMRELVKVVTDEASS